MKKSEKLRILFITYRADKSGGALVLLNLLHDLKFNHNREVEIYVCAPGNEVLSSEFKAIACDFLPLLKGVSFFNNWPRVNNFCKTHGINILHSHGRGAGVLSRLFGGNKLKFHSFHGIHFEKSFKGYLKTYLDKLLAFRCDAYICSSRSEKLAGENYRFIPPHSSVAMIPHKYLNKVTCRNEVRSVETITIGTLTRLETGKGSLELIDFFTSKLRDQPFHLKIAGSGAFEEFAKSKVKNSGLSSKIEFLGFIDDKEHFFESIDIYISFSEGEGMPMSVLEAMAHGIPCLLSNVRGHIDFNNDYETCWFFNKYDHNACLEILNSIVNFKDETFRRVNNANYLVEKLTCMDWGGEYLRHYKFIINGKKNVY